MSEYKTHKMNPGYKELVDSLLTRISTNEFPVGSMLPPENKLCIEFGVSRYAVRVALKNLEEMGIISRHQGSGTKVKAKTPTGKYVQSLNSLEEFLEYPKDTTLHLLKAYYGKIEDDLREILSSTLKISQEKWFVIDVVRRASNGISLMQGKIYLLPQYSGIKDWIGTDSSPVHKLIEQQFGQRANKVEIRMLAGSISPEDAQVLRVPPGTPALIVVRLYIDTKGDIYEISIIKHPAHRFTYSMSLQHAWIGTNKTT